MKKANLLTCKTHPNQRLNKFCKEVNCWIRLCTKCATEAHKGHQVIDYTNLSNEAKNAKEKLLQAKKGDLISLKRILSNMSMLEGQLKEAEEKHKEDKRLAEMHLFSKIEKVAEEGESKFKQLTETLQKLQKALNEFYDAQAQEVTKIPQLADAVISQGTTEDIKTFLEMCQQGIESNSEILAYKKDVDLIRENIQKYSSQNPFDFAFKLDESITLSQLPDISSEKSFKETLSRTLTSTDLPILNKKTLPIQTSNAKENKSIKNGRHSRIKSALANDFSSMIGTSMTTRNVNKLPVNLTSRGMPSKRLTSSRVSLCDTISRPNAISSKTVARKPQASSVKSAVKKSQIHEKAKQANVTKIEELKVIKKALIELKDQLKKMAEEMKGKSVVCIISE